jgi:2-dehydro-3-deoxy-D-arabinonate dehydratase
MNFKIYKVMNGILISDSDRFCLAKSADWDVFINQPDILNSIERMVASVEPLENGERMIETELLPPIGTQEVWAAGVTYFRSRDARMEEAEATGGDVFYNRVYDAERPELFFKAPAGRVVTHGQSVRIRKDSTWDVPEPEFTLVINSAGEIIGYTIGNDMSSRSIEGENPLYLPQAKMYDGSAAIGPCVLISDEFDLAQTTISLIIGRNGEEIFSGETSLSQMKRKPKELQSFLYREMSFPVGAYLMTGTGIVPDPPFTLQSGDKIRITISGIGTLENFVE